MNYSINETNLQRQHLLSAILNPVTVRALTNISLKPQSKILDIGCGLGDTTLMLHGQFSNSIITGIDSDEALIQVACEEKQLLSDHLNFICADALHLPFVDDSFDLVFTRLCLHHIPDPIIALREMKRVCKHGGTVFAQEPDIHSIISYPESWGYQKHKEYLNQIADALFGRKLISHLRLLKLENISHHVECVMGDQNNSVKQFLAMTCGAMGNALIQKNIATEAEHDAVVKELERAQQDVDTIVIMAPSVAVWGTKI